jgi:hypothetical protein
MNPNRTRSIALVVLASFVLCLSGVRQVLAAGGSVRGRVTTEGGALPPGSLVRATPLDGEASLEAPIASDGAYSIPQIPEGAYRFEVVGPGGEVLGTARVLMTPSLLELALRAEVALDPSIAPQEEAPPVKRGPRAGLSDAKRKWLIAAVIIGGLGLGFLVGDDDDGSPSQP